MLAPLSLGVDETVRYFSLICIEIRVLYSMSVIISPENYNVVQNIMQFEATGNKYIYRGV